MVSLITQIPFIYFVILITAFIVLIFLISYRFLRRKTDLPLEKRFQGLENERSSSQHRAVFVDLSPKSADVVELAVEVWRMSNRILKATNGLTDAQKRGLESSIQKFIKFLDHNDIKFIDHTGQKYNEGMNIEVLSFEKDQTVKSPFIKETIEPSITYKSMIVKKGKVVVINN